MKHFLAGFALCFLLACLATWAYDLRENAPVQSTAWFAHDDQTYKMSADIELLNQRILATCNSIERVYQGMTADNQIVQQNKLFDDVQLAKGVANILANTTFDVALLRKLRGYGRQELGYNLISDGFTVDIFIDAANLNNDGLIQVEQITGGTVLGIKPLLIALRNNMDEAHALASRLKCDSKPQPPIHLYAVTP